MNTAEVNTDDPHWLDVGRYKQITGFSENATHTFSDLRVLSCMGVIVIYLIMQR